MKRFLPLLVLLLPGLAQAQSLTFSDPCQAYAHKTTLLPTLATPTAKLLSAVTGTQIYVCALHLAVQVQAATPAAETFYTGTGTTCGTGGSTIGQYSSAPIGQSNNIGDGTHTLMTASGDLCVVQNTTAVPYGSIEYVVH